MAITRQAMMVSYVDSFWLLFVACLAVMPLVLFLRRRQPDRPILGAGRPFRRGQIDAGPGR